MPTDVRLCMLRIRLLTQGYAKTVGKTSKGVELLTKHEYTFISLLIALSILVVLMIIQLNMIKLQNLSLNRFVLENCNIKRQEIVTEYGGK